jgi:hypothetical protein
MGARSRYNKRAGNKEETVMADFSLAPGDFMRAQTALELMEANELTERFGLTLGPIEIARIAQKRFDALRNAGRVEFTRGIVRSLIEAFCDSPYIRQDEYEETVCELIDSFYYFRNESDGLIPDEDLIECMRAHFDGVCQGSLEYLNGTTLFELLRSGRRADQD